MSLTESCNYSASELKDALASLSTTTAANDSTSRADLIHDCNHIHGFDGRSDAAAATDAANATHDDDDCSYFVDGHELSMLQTITARRVLDYDNLLVRLSFPNNFFF